MSFHIRVSSRGIVLSGDKILLIDFGDGEYLHIPGGGVEPGETVKEAVVREIFEETGLIVKAGELVFALDYEPESCGYVNGNTPQVSFFFRCRLCGDDTIKPPSVPDRSPDRPEIRGKAKWVEITKLQSINFIPHIAEELMEYLITGRFTPLFVESRNLK